MAYRIALGKLLGNRTNSHTRSIHGVEYNAINAERGDTWVLDDVDILILLAMLLGGAGAGFINAVAGGGSALTLPLLMFAGLDASVANGTNRVAVGIQAATATASFHRQGVRPWRASIRDGVVIILGALVGAFGAVRIPSTSLETIFGVIFLLLAVLIIAKPSWLTPSADDLPSRPVTRGVSFFLIGLYGGVFQAGVGVPLLLGFVNLVGMDVARANAAKVAVVLVYTVLVLFVFQSAGQVDWVYGITLGLGGVLGSVVGTRAVMDKGVQLVRVVLIIALLGGAARSLLA